MFQPAIRTIAFRGAALLLAVGASAGIASADSATPSTAVTTSTTGVANSRHVAKPALVALHKQIAHDERQALLKALNLTPKQLRQDRRAGESIAVIAQGENVALTTVSTAMTAAAQTDLDQAVAAGTLKPKREQHLLSRLQTQLPKRLHATPHPHVNKHAKGASTSSTTRTTTSTTAN
jgi:methylphosphotriester-DNA--protein-cysteine methyltransferase